MKRLKISDQTNFIGCWNLDDDNLCKDIVNLFEQNKQFHQRGATGSGINENIKKSIDMVVHPKNINTKEFELFKVYLNKLFDCYQDYKKIWPFIDQRIPKVDIPSFNVQKYEKSGHFADLHCERDHVPTMHRVFAWMTYLNDVDDGGETYFEHYDLKIKPEIGKTLIWPAEWTHAHKGEVLKSGLKYIVTGWMHFPFNFQVPQKV